MKNVSMTRRDSGAVSIFVVIFAALLITVVTISFIRIMINDQRQATANDLSQSAYDSAQAGVEDAKRALLRYLSVCQTSPSSCGTLATQLSVDECNTAVRIGGVAGDGSTSGEIRVQQTSSSTDDALDQAYTCVKIKMNTDDYVGSLATNESQLVPLRSDQEFNTVTIEWFSREDLGDATTGTTVSLSSSATIPKPLLQQSSWPANRPPVFRAQMMQVGDDFTLEQFDYATGGESNANTVFMYPVGAAGNTTTSFIARDARKNAPGAATPKDISTDTPLPTQCQPSLALGGYSCRLSLQLPNPIGSSGAEREAYLRLTPFYTATHFRVTLSLGVTPRSFSGVQPEIDSTGRANELFRRIVSRVDLIDTNFPYPEAALDVTGNLCKNFSVTDTNYIASTTTPCTP